MLVVTPALAMKGAQVLYLESCRLFHQFGTAGWGRSGVTRQLYWIKNLIYPARHENRIMSKDLIILSVSFWNESSNG